ncbi:MAG: CRISPR-associated protein Cas5, partial [Bacillota bacterium]
MNSEVTVFEASGPIAMFRKPYTTTSSVSFAFPPPTAIAGMIAAIIGIPNGS